MRLAVIADIHGNLPALHAVLEDIQKQHVDDIICLGDLGNAGPFPSERIDEVRALNCITIQGNHELYVLGQYHDAENIDEDPTWGVVRWARKQLREDQRRRDCETIRTEYENLYKPRQCLRRRVH